MRERDIAFEHYPDVKTGERVIQAKEKAKQRQWSEGLMGIAERLDRVLSK